MREPPTAGAPNLRELRGETELERDLGARFANLTCVSHGPASASGAPLVPRTVPAASHAHRAHSPEGPQAARHRGSFNLLSRPPLASLRGERPAGRGPRAGSGQGGGAAGRPEPREERARTGLRRARASGRAGREGPFVTEQTLPPPLTRGGRGRAVR